jgi:SEL1 protein
MHLAKRFYDLASETSVDAHVPVALALFKLNALIYLDGLFDSNSFSAIWSPSLYFGSLWDVYLMTFLGGLITAIYFIRQRIV